MNIILNSVKYRVKTSLVWPDLFGSYVGSCVLILRAHAILIIDIDIILFGVYGLIQYYKPQHNLS